MPQAGKVKDRLIWKTILYRFLNISKIRKYDT